MTLHWTPERRPGIFARFSDRPRRDVREPDRREAPGGAVRSARPRRFRRGLIYDNVLYQMLTLVTTRFEWLTFGWKLTTFFVLYIN